MGSSMGSYKVNTSGVSRGNQSGYGGILRDESGCWVRGFMGHLGTTTSCLVTEIQAVIKGVELIDSLRLKNTTLETDSMFAFDVLEKPDLYAESCVWRGKISDCQKLIKKNGVTLSCITTEGNNCAHFLANLAMNNGDGDGDDEYEDVLDPPPGIEYHIMADNGKIEDPL